MTNSDPLLSLSDTSKHGVSKGLSSCAGSLVLLGNTSSLESTETSVLAPLSCTGLTNSTLLLLEQSRYKYLEILRIIKRHSNKVDSTTITVRFKAMQIRQRNTACIKRANVTMRLSVIGFMSKLEGSNRSRIRHLSPPAANARLYVCTQCF